MDQPHKGLWAKRRQRQPAPELFLPFGGHYGLEGTVQVLLEAQLKGLAYSADDALG